MKFILIFIIILYGCSSKIESNNSIYFETKKSQFINWRKDSLGCLNYRYEIIDKKKINFDSIINKNIDTVINYMGNPNLIENSKYNKKIIYYISCKYKPPVKNIDRGIHEQNDSLTPTKDITKLVIHFREGNITKVETVLP